MTLLLPAAVQAAVDAIDGADIDAFVAALLPDGRILAP